MNFTSSNFSPLQCSFHCCHSCFWKTYCICGSKVAILEPMEQSKRKPNWNRKNKVKNVVWRQHLRRMLWNPYSLSNKIELQHSFDLTIYLGISKLWKKEEFQLHGNFYPYMFLKINFVPWRPSVLCSCRCHSWARYKQHSSCYSFRVFFTWMSMSSCFQNTF